MAAMMHYLSAAIPLALFAPVLLDGVDTSRLTKFESSAEGASNINQSSIGVSSRWPVSKFPIRTPHFAQTGDPSTPRDDGIDRKKGR